MADEEDYTIENSDAGAALATPISAGELKKGGYMLIKGRPCKILSISVSKTGKVRSCERATPSRNIIFYSSPLFASSLINLLLIPC